MPRLITMEVSRLLVNSLGDADVYWECNGCHPGLSEDVVITASKVAFMANGFVPDGAERNPENLCPLRCERRGQPFTPAKFRESLPPFGAREKSPIMLCTNAEQSHSQTLRGL